MTYAEIGPVSWHRTSTAAHKLFVRTRARLAESQSNVEHIDATHLLEQQDSSRLQEADSMPVWLGTDASTLKRDWQRRRDHMICLGNAVDVLAILQTYHVRTS
jgi:hypothetical protein